MVRADVGCFGFGVAFCMSSALLKGKYLAVQT